MRETREEASVVVGDAPAMNAPLATPATPAAAAAGVCACVCCVLCLCVCVRACVCEGDAKRQVWWCVRVCVCV